MLTTVDFQSYSILQAIFLGLSLNPEAVKKAHLELDAVVGSHRFPEHADRDSLTYVSAIILEAIRWHVVIPIGAVHYTTADDEYRGYFIPAQTLIMPNTWCALLSSSDERQTTRLTGHACTTRKCTLIP